MGRKEGSFAENTRDVPGQRILNKKMLRFSLIH
jgi:hypothetical protein